jgi:hypothetical protein
VRQGAIRAPQCPQKTSPAAGRHWAHRAASDSVVGRLVVGARRGTKEPWSTASGEAEISATGPLPDDGAPGADAGAPAGCRATRDGRRAV